MAQVPTGVHPTAEDGDLAMNVASFRRHLRAQNVSSNTVAAYTSAVEQFADYLVEQGMPTDVAKIKREHIEAFIAWMLDATKPDGSKRWKPATANNRFRGCQRFFNWLVEEGEIKDSPMARMKPPRIPEQAPEVIREDDLKKLLATCKGDTSFTGRRDYALLMVLIDTGIRRGEAAGLRYTPNDDTTNDVGLDDGMLRVLGKGRRERLVGIGCKSLWRCHRYRPTKHGSEGCPGALGNRSSVP